jgi:hypothetical protein
LDYFDNSANTIWLFGKTNSFGVGKTDMRLTQVDENQKVDKNQPAEDIRPISHLDFKTARQVLLKDFAGRSLSK